MSKIKLEVGMSVFCPPIGNGVIFDIVRNISRPIKGAFSFDLVSFTECGKRYVSDLSPSLKLLNIPFAEGMEVECDIYGSGVVYAVNPDADTALRVSVQFADGHFIHYTIDGRIDLKANITLSPKYEIEKHHEQSNQRRIAPHRTTRGRN